MNSNTINNCPNLQAETSMTFKIGTSTIMQIQLTQLLMSMPINMNSKLINGLGNGVATTDAVNKSQMDTANLLKMDKANGVGTGRMTLTHTDAQLKLVSTLSQGNIILQNPIGSMIDFWSANDTPPCSNYK